MVESPPWAAATIVFAELAPAAAPRSKSEPRPSRCRPCPRRSSDAGVLRPPRDGASGFVEKVSSVRPLMRPARTSPSMRSVDDKTAEQI